MEFVRQRLREMRTLHERNLVELEAQKAQFGIQVPLEIANGILHERDAIEKIDSTLQALKTLDESMPASAQQAAGAWIDYETERLRGDVEQLRRELSTWQVKLTEEMIEMGEQQVTPLQEQLRQLNTSIRELSSQQSAMQREMQAVLAQVSTTVAINSQRITMLERLGVVAMALASVLMLVFAAALVFAR